MPNPYTENEFIKAFWNRIDIKELFSCWEWTKGRDAYGYGLVKRLRKTRRCHRVAWSLTYGPIPDGLWVLHHCDNRLCCNPGHLFLGTHADNMRDMTEKERGTRGERSSLSKLTAQDVKLIRELGATGLPHNQIAKRFPVQRAQISKIINGTAWPG